MEFYIFSSLRNLHQVETICTRSKDQNSTSTGWINPFGIFYRKSFKTCYLNTVLWLNLRTPLSF